MKIAAPILFLATTSMLAQSAVPPRDSEDMGYGGASTLEVPHPDPSYSPVPVSADITISVPVRPVYKTYPVYAPGREPAHYLEWLGNKNRKLPLTLHNSIPR